MGQREKGNIDFSLAGWLIPEIIPTVPQRGGGGGAGRENVGECSYVHIQNERTERSSDNCAGTHSKRI